MCFTEKKKSYIQVWNEWGRLKLAFSMLSWLQQALFTTYRTIYSYIQNIQFYICSWMFCTKCGCCFFLFSPMWRSYRQRQYVESEVHRRFCRFVLLSLHFLRVFYTFWLRISTSTLTYAFNLPPKSLVLGFLLFLT